MIVDKQDYFLTTGGSEELGAHTNGNSDYRDFHAAGAMDTSKKKYLVIQGVSALSGGTTPKVTITLKSGTDGSTFGTTDWSSGAIDVPTGTIRVQLPEAIKRYGRIEWALSGSPTGGGKFKAFLYVE